MLMVPSKSLNPTRQALTTMQQADPRLLRLVQALTFAFIVMSLVVVALGCSPKLHVINEGLDLATLLMFAMLPVLYLSGKRNS